MLLTPGVWWGPVVDGTELPRQPLDMIRAGDFARVPLIIGANRDEGILHTISFDSVAPAEVEGFVRGVFGDEAARVVPAKYARATPKDALSDIVGDGIFVCQARRVARAFAQAGVPAYLYHFTHALDDPRVKPLGATHSVELFFVFGNTSQGYGLSDGEQPLSRTIMDAWAAFARTGNPSTTTLPWPRYSAERDQHLTLDSASVTGAQLKKEACDFWDALDHRPGS
jgi:para-nitrobenzyl esterase